ncbi:bifunctional 3-demethylubiquinone 3-O-methyltransferase/2-octaprenyl-6-hydroxy phenol methylase [Niveibacterium umoris]|uniref:Ubiquinone biosynthesis O-methyltransferase n=1 Tax=Niveibacterium umoris TaxID=1193620 RepID=A0A840BI60_9RHOO|nr:bifunctional 2-polyprenyl-6-hydroxyphenol methylase/3-demethylubiquinol 3-O-methyltransferase UbiG [Niveibacterium umoris]MBB4012004.1 2-polyprenyl-6-hydroxyphenyl methylase/3-demethylubiquinone-9 3-methyltransferase [Niveibacterium umoris]
MTTATTSTNADPAELHKFSELAHRWWDPESEFKPLHQINPLRLEWIDRHAAVRGKRTIDIGCGGGILSESMAAKGADVTGIDLSDKALGVARLHLYESGQKVDYRKIAAEDMAAAEPETFDVVTCMEMLEHVPDPASTVKAAARLAKPGGHVFFSTLNRNPKSYLFAVIGAEYILGLLPRGTHEYARFIKPSELARFARDAGLMVEEVIGMTYNPITQVYALGRDTDVNYLVRCRKPA